MQTIGCLTLLVRDYDEAITFFTECLGFVIHEDTAQPDAKRSRGVEFSEAPRRERYGTVAVFEDLYGNRWDLIQPASRGA